MEEKIVQLQAQLQHEREAEGRAQESISNSNQLLQQCFTDISQAQKDLEWIDKQNQDLVTESRLYQLSTREFDFPMVDQLPRADMKLVVELARSCKAMEVHLRAMQERSALTSTNRVVEVTLILHESLDPDKKTNLPVQGAKTQFKDLLQVAIDYWSLTGEFQLEYVVDGGCLVIGSDLVPLHVNKLILRELPTPELRPMSAPPSPLPPPPPLLLPLPPPLAGVSEKEEETSKRPYYQDSKLAYHIELLLTILLATSFSVLSLEENNVPSAYQSRLAVQHLFANDYEFDSIDSAMGMFNWMRSILDQPAATVVVAGQLRMNTSVNCNAVLGSCVSDFIPPQQPVPFPIVINSAFEYNPNEPSACWPGMVSGSLPGQYMDYPVRDTDRYSIALSSATVVDELEQNGWVDASTRLVTIAFTLSSSPSLCNNQSMLLPSDTGKQALVNVIAAFEFLPSGQVVSRWHSTTMFNPPGFFGYDVAFIALVCVAVGLRLVSSKSLSVLDALLVLFAGLYYASQRQLQDIYSNCVEIDYRGVAMQTSLTSNLQGIVIVLLSMRMLLFLDASPSTSFLFTVCRHLLSMYAAIVLLSVVGLVLGFGLVAHFEFGRATYQLSVVDLALASLWISFTPAFGVETSWGGIVLYILAYLCLYLVIYSLVVSMVARSYFYVADRVRKHGHTWLVAGVKEDHHLVNNSLRKFGQ